MTTFPYESVVSDTCFRFLGVLHARGGGGRERTHLLIALVI